LRIERWGGRAWAAAAALPLLAVLLGTGPAEAAWQEGIVAGTVRTAAGEPLAGALVEVEPAAGGGAPTRTSTDEAGAFRVRGLRPGSYRIRATYLGRAPAEQEFHVPAAGGLVRLELVLAEAAVPVEGVTVEVERARHRFRTEAGAPVQELTGDELKLIPGLAEADVLRAVVVLPGVVSTSDFSAAYNVRGGSADQNLVLLDGVPLFNPFHLGGLFSVFNPDLVERAELLAGGFPAQYGGRVSSVLAVESAAGAGGPAVDAGISLLAARLAVGVPLPTAWVRPLGLEAARVRVSGRRSYADQVLRPVLDFPYHLRDVQGFGEAWAPGGGRITATGYSGRDVLDLAGLDPDDFPLRLDWRWGNDAAGVRWTRPTDFGTVQLHAGGSRFETTLAFPDFDDTRLGSRIWQWSTGAAAELGEEDGARLRIGGEIGGMGYANRAAAGGTVFRQSAAAGWQGAAHAQALLRPGRWLVDAGVRADGWAPGPAPASLFVSPRLSVKRFVGPGDAAFRLAAGRYVQFVHSLRDEELPLGIDIWVTAGERAPPVVSDQAHLGFEAYPARRWRIVVESFVRRYEGVTTNNFADDPNTPADDLLAGRGLSYGADLLLRRRAGRLDGWLAVSWLRATRTFPDTRMGGAPPPTLRYPPIFDRRLDLELLLQYRLPADIAGGIRLSRGSGLPYTRPLGSYPYLDPELVHGGRLSPIASGSSDDWARAVVLGPRNAERYPAYRRVDASFRRTFRPGWGTITPHLEVLNLTNERNVLFYFYQYDRTPPVRSGFSMFPVLPTIGVEVSLP
jgi:hypothetical protein